LPRLSVALLIIVDYLRRRFARFKLCADFLDFGGLLFELGCENLYLCLLLGDRCLQLLNFVIQHGLVTRSASATSRTGTGPGPLACFIGGIFNNFQPVGGAVVEVTLDLSNDELGWDVGPSNQPHSAPVQRGAPQPAARPQRIAFVGGEETNEVADVSVIEASDHVFVLWNRQRQCYHCHQRY